MNLQDLIKKLKDLQNELDPEKAHGEADDLLLEYINNKDVKEAFEQVNKWYS